MTDRRRPGGADEGGPDNGKRRIERPLPVVAPSAFLRVKFAQPACGRSARVGRTSCARSHRVSRL
jgi:hypothetical protein